MTWPQLESASSDILILIYGVSYHGNYSVPDNEGGKENALSFLLIEIPLPPVTRRRTLNIPPESTGEQGGGGDMHTRENTHCPDN